MSRLRRKGTIVRIKVENPRKINEETIGRKKCVFFCLEGSKDNPCVCGFIYSIEKQIVGIKRGMDVEGVCKSCLTKGPSKSNKNRKIYARYTYKVGGINMRKRDHLSLVYHIIIQERK